MSGESWREVNHRLELASRALSLRDRLTVAAGGVVGALGVFFVLEEPGLFPSRGWWAGTLAACLVGFFAGYAYLWVWMISRSRRRRRRGRRAAEVAGCGAPRAGAAERSSAAHQEREERGRGGAGG